MKNIIYIVIVGVLLCIVLHQYGIINQPLTPVITTDTVVQHDTLYYPSPYPVEKRIVDTLYLTLDETNKDDSIVEIPIEQKVYNDSNYHAVISGFQPKIDTLIIYPKTYTIYNTKTVYKAKKGLFIAPSAGLGYGVISKKPDLWLGVSIGYKF